MGKHFVVMTALAALAISMLVSSGPAGSTSAGRLSAAATFSSHDKSGCIGTEVSVFVRRGGAGQVRLELRVLQADECSDSASVNIEDVISLPAGALRVATDLSSASLDTSVPVADRQSRGKVTAALHLKWNATEKMVTAMRGDEPDGLATLVHMKMPVKRSIRLSAATGTIYLRGSTIALANAESAWIARAEGGVPVSQ